MKRDVVLNIKIAKQLTRYRLNFEKIVLSVINTIGSERFGSLEIVVQTTANKPALNRLEGVGGFCPSPHFVQISIVAYHPKFLRDPEGAFSRSLAHELYHAARFYSRVSKARGSFLQSIVDEGLADQFVWEFTGTLPVWNKPLPGSVRNRLLKIIRQQQKNNLSDNDYDEWFLRGSKSKRIPRWAGYSLGLFLVRRYLVQHPKLSAKNLITFPAQKFII